MNPLHPVVRAVAAVLLAAFGAVTFVEGIKDAFVNMTVVSTGWLLHWPGLVVAIVGATAAVEGIRSLVSQVRPRRPNIRPVLTEEN